MVAAAMGVAGEVGQGFEIAEDSDMDRGAEGMFNLGESGQLVTQQKAAQFIGAVGEGSHYVIVPTGTIPTVRNYNKSQRSWLPLKKSTKRLFFRVTAAPRTSEVRS